MPAVWSGNPEDIGFEGSTYPEPASLSSRYRPDPETRWFRLQRYVSDPNGAVGATFKVPGRLRPACLANSFPDRGGGSTLNNCSITATWDAWLQVFIRSRTPHHLYRTLYTEHQRVVMRSPPRSCLLLATLCDVKDRCGMGMNFGIHDAAELGRAPRAVPAGQPHSFARPVRTG